MLRWSPRMSLKKQLLHVVFFFTMSTTVMFVFYYNESNIVLSKLENEVCEIPKLDPLDSSISKYISGKSKTNHCPRANSIVFVNESGFLHFNQSVLRYYFLQHEVLKCTYQAVERVLGDADVKFGSRKRIVPPVFVNNTYFRVSCVNSSRLVYDWLHFNPFWIEDRSREYEIGAESDDHYSILLIGIDSVSRSHALRSLPRTYDYLTGTLGAYDFRGYMKVGSNSFPNLIPLLTGMHYGNFPLVNSMLSYCDSMPLLWKDKALKRYATIYSEDRPDISTFNSLKPGFYIAPTDVYYRPYSMAMNLFTPVLINPIACQVDCLCYGNKDNFTVQIDHFKGFLNRYKGRLKFSFFWANRAHESLDNLQQLDIPLLNFLQWMKFNGHMEKAIVAVLSDHGMRLGEFSETYMGRLEGHLPLFSLIVPQKLQKMYPSVRKNLMLNTKRLVTPFDVHKTVLDIANNNFKPKVVPVSNSLIARNIFNVIPETRTCADAGIPSYFCKCIGDKTILFAENEVLLKTIATYAVSRLNSALANHTDICSFLELYNITESRVQYSCASKERNYHRNSLLVSAMSLLKYRIGFDSEKCGKSGRYKLLFYTVPGKGLFEAMVELIEDTGNEDSDKMILVGDIVRVNRYGKQSHCIKNSELLRQYCYCRDLE